MNRNETGQSSDPDAFPASATPRGGRISLAGDWRYALERYDNALAEGWMNGELSADWVRLPGSLAEQGIGDEVTAGTRWTGSIFDPAFFTRPEYERYRRPGNIKLPFWLQPEKHYTGVALYQREFEIPESWRGRRVILTMERPHWETRVWVDGRDFGSNDSLSVPHVYDLGAAWEPGFHTLTIRVDNRPVVDVGVNAHSISDHTQGNWNGIVGRIELSVTGAARIDDLQVYPDAAEQSVRVTGRIDGLAALAGSVRVRVTAEPLEPEAGAAETGPSVVVEPDGDGGFSAEYSLGPAARLWDEFDPARHRLTAELEGQGGIMDSRQVVIGLRDVAVEGTRITINGRERFLRGTLECCIFPRTGYPPTDVPSWRRIVSIARAYGLNHLRFHSWCPPEAAFVAADEMGLYLQVECATWPNQGATLGDGRPLDTWIEAETDRILKAYGNHPSFILMACGNEPDGHRHAEWLRQWIERCRAADSRHLYTGGAGWPEIPENQFHVTHRPRVHQWGDGLQSRINARPPETCTDYREMIESCDVPVISHEIGQWCAYPNFAEMEKYTGHLKPKNFEIFRETLEANGLGDRAKDFLLASGKLQTLCYKEEIESALRTPGMGGFQLLDLHDFPGQGTALVGVLDAFWDEKGYVTAEEYRRFCDAIVPLARMEKRVFTQGEFLEAGIEVAHFGATPLEDAEIIWRLEDDAGGIAADGRIAVRHIPIGNGRPAGELRIDLRDAKAPARYKLVVRIVAGTRVAENDWDVWVYPDRADVRVPEGIVMTDTLDEQTVARLREGASVLLLPPAGRVDLWRSEEVALGFSSIFWNTAWTGRQAPHTLGLLCDPEHPALADFPTDFYSNWQWWYLVSRAAPLFLEGLPSGIEPVVRVIDDWVTNRNLGLLFEVRVGEGKLLVCGIDLRGDTDTNPVARQMLSSLLRYMNGADFRPRHALPGTTAEAFRNLSLYGRGPRAD